MYSLMRSYIVAWLALAGLIATLAAVFLSSSAVESLSSAPQGQYFTRDLSLNSTGSDVRELQVILNEDPQTQVAAGGPGSPGQETEYFGAMTKQAVIRFQNEYAADILFPVGLSQGTGYVGASTRAKLNELYARDHGIVSNTSAGQSNNSGIAQPQGSLSVDQSPASSSPATSSSTSDLPPQQIPQDVINQTAAQFPAVARAFEQFNAYLKKKLVVLGVSPLAAPAGVSMDISGVGFETNGNIVHIASTTIAVSSIDGSDLLFSMPHISPGRYLLWVEDNKGNVSNKDLYITVEDPALPAPTVESVTANSVVQLGDTITVHGSGFAKENNYVITGLKTTGNVPSSDGKTLTVTIEPPDAWAEYLKAVNGARTMQTQVWLRVSNNGGISNAIPMVVAI